MEEKIRAYFAAWMKRDAGVLDEVFARDVVYVECYGPEYCGLDQMHRWFRKWNAKGKVLEWEITRTICQGNTVVAEWYFHYAFEGKEGKFDGVTVADFDNKGKIVKLCEYKSEHEHYFPFG